MLGLELGRLARSGTHHLLHLDIRLWLLLAFLWSVLLRQLLRQHFDHRGAR